jgi:hypothetical protein
MSALDTAAKPGDEVQLKRQAGFPMSLMHSLGREKVRGRLTGLSIRARRRRFEQTTELSTSMSTSPSSIYMLRTAYSRKKRTSRSTFRAAIYVQELRDLKQCSGTPWWNKVSSKMNYIVKRSNKRMYWIYPSKVQTNSFSHSVKQRIWQLSSIRWTALLLIFLHGRPCYWRTTCKLCQHHGGYIALFHVR